MTISRSVHSLFREGIPKKRFINWLAEQQLQGNHLICRCSRPIDVTKQHCANCGSTNCYASRIGPQDLQTGEEVTAVQYKCRRCGIYFTDVEAFYHCEAPEPQPKMKDVRKKAKADSLIQMAGFKGVSDFKQQLEDFRKQREKKESEES